MDKKPTIIHVIESLVRGGAETLLVGVVTTLAQFDHVIVTLKDKNEFVEELKGIRIISLNHKAYRTVLSTTSRLRAILKEFQAPVIIHSHLFWGNIIARFAAPKTISLINSYHSMSYGRMGANYPLHAVMLDRLSYNWRKPKPLTLCVSNEVKKNIRQFIGIVKKTEVLYNYISDSFFDAGAAPYIHSTPSLFVAVGNLKEAKNYPVLLKAVAILNSLGYRDRFSIDIYGKGPLEAMLNAYIADNKLYNVNLKGSTSNVAGLLAQYQAYILCSGNEGFGLAVAEAMAAGLPAILSDLKVLREITDNTGLFFDPANPEDLAEKLRSMIDGQVETIALSVTGREKAEAYRQGVYMSRLSNIYDNCFSETLK